MKEINRHLADIDNQLERLGTSLLRLQDRQQMIVQVLGWLLANHPGDSALRSLSSLANDLEAGNDLPDHVTLLDELRKHVMDLQAFWSEARQSSTKEKMDNS